LYEVEADATFIEVDSKTKRTADGADFRAIHGLGLVPALDLGDGTVLTENAAVLQYVADRFPEAGLAPRDAMGRARLQQWLSFIGTELHKGLFAPLFDASTPEEAKQYALRKGASRMAWLATQLEGRELLLERFSVADAFLSTVLNWCAVTPVDLDAYPAIGAYLARVRARPSVARAFKDERVLYAAELQRAAR
jgi:glutathione S-transferase